MQFNTRNTLSAEAENPAQASRPALADSPWAPTWAAPRELALCGPLELSGLWPLPSHGVTVRMTRNSHPYRRGIGWDRALLTASLPLGRGFLGSEQSW